MSARVEDIEYWWSGGFPGAFQVDTGLESRLQGAFTRVLQAMSDGEFERFMDLNPTIICLPGVSASVFRYSVFEPVGPEPGRVHAMYFSPNLGRCKDETIADIVAHESAHLLLNHHLELVSVSDDRAERETAADELSKSWGFKPRYTQKMIRDLVADRERLREAANR